MTTTTKSTVVTVVGAGGYIGLAVAKELASRGHTVYGVIRSEAGASELVKNEIIPVIGSSVATNIALLDTYFERSSTVIEATGDPSLAVPRAVIARLETVAARTSTPKHYIFTCGCNLYEPTTADKPLDESSPVIASAPRSAYDAEILAGATYPHVRATVLRPGWLYGGSSGKLLAGLDFFPPRNNASTLYVVHGTPTTVWPWIHVADLARAYADVAETADERTFGHVFNVSDNVSFATRREVHEAFARAAGYTGAIEFVRARADPFSQKVDKNIPYKVNEKLHNATGWRPRFGPVTDPAVAQRVVAAQAEHAKE